MTDKPLIIKGGTLIDGSGHAPVEDSVIIIEHGRFKAIGRGSDGPNPHDADVIDATG